jgi:hypothetical protein
MFSFGMTSLIYCVISKVFSRIDKHRYRRTKGLALINDNIIRAKIGSVVFPEVCPVCMNEADDIVRMTVNLYSYGGALESSNPQAALREKLARSNGQITFALPGLSFSVPVCNRHLPKEIPDLHKVIWFCCMLGGIYPGVFYLLLTANAIHRRINFFPFLIPWIITILILGAISGYIFFPRAFQRYFKFLEFEPTGENIFLHLGNSNYRDLFLENNPMNAEIIDTSNLNSEVAV